MARHAQAVVWKRRMVAGATDGLPSLGALAAMGRHAPSAAGRLRHADRRRRRQAPPTLAANVHAPAPVPAHFLDAH